MIDLLVDFNALVGDRRILLADIPSEPITIGDRVHTHDEDGNALLAVVHEIDHASDVVCLEPLWDTWASGDEEASSSSVKVTLEHASVDMVKFSELRSVRYGGSEGISYEPELPSGVKIPSPA